MHRQKKPSAAEAALAASIALVRFAAAESVKAKRVAAPRRGLNPRFDLLLLLARDEVKK